MVSASWGLAGVCGHEARELFERMLSLRKLLENFGIRDGWMGRSGNLICSWLRGAHIGEEIMLLCLYRRGSKLPCHREVPWHFFHPFRTRSAITAWGPREGVPWKEVSPQFA